VSRRTPYAPATDADCEDVSRLCLAMELGAQLSFSHAQLLALRTQAQEGIVQLYIVSILSRRDQEAFAHERGYITAKLWRASMRYCVLSIFHGPLNNVLMRPNIVVLLETIRARWYAHAVILHLQEFGLVCTGLGYSILPTMMHMLFDEFADDEDAPALLRQARLALQAERELELDRATRAARKAVDAAEEEGHVEWAATIRADFGL
jgi:hypothetical protein